MSYARIAAIGLAFALVVLSPASLPSLERPTWTAGDSWTYATNTTLLPGLNLTGTVVWTMRGRVATPVGTGSVDAYDMLLSGSGTAAGTISNGTYTVQVAGAWILTAEERFEPVNFQLIYSVLDLSVNGTYQGVFQFTSRVQNTTTFEILSSTWDYPFQSLTEGNVTVRYDFTQDSVLNGPFTANRHENGTGQWTEEFSASLPVVVGTPAGSFEAFPINEAWPDGSRRVSFGSATVGNAARTEVYGSDGNMTSVSVLASYRYQALEAPTFLGLTAVQWAIVLPVVAAVAVGLLLYRRRRKKRTAMVGVGAASEDLTSGPRGP